MSARARIFWSALLLVAFADSANADGIVRDSVGGVSSGRGGANIAHFDNGVVLLSNPAGMTNVDGRGLAEFGADFYMTDLDYSDPQNSANARFGFLGLPQGSYIRKSDDGRLAAGLGVYVPAGFSTRWQLNGPPPIFGERTYKSIGALAKITPGIAYRVTDRLSVGATLGVGVSHAELEGPFFLRTAGAGVVPTLFDVQATGAAPVWSAGLQYRLNDRTMLGLAYVGETRLQMDGTVRATAFIPPAPMQSNFDAEMDLVWPRSLGVGVTHLVSRRHRVSADILWYDWSHAFDRIDLQLTNASNPVFAAMGTINDRLPLNWKDSISARLGYEYFATCCDVFRAGYVLNTETTPGSTLTPYLPATLQHTFSVGYGREWGSRRLDLAYQFAFGPERNVTDSDLPGDDFSDSELKAQAHWVFISFTQRY